MRPVDWVVMTLTLIIALVFFVVGAENLILGERLDDKRAELAVGVIASILSIISAYVGSRIGRDRE